MKALADMHEKALQDDLDGFEFVAGSFGTPVSPPDDPSPPEPTDPPDALLNAEPSVFSRQTINAPFPSIAFRLISVTKKGAQLKFNFGAGVLLNRFIEPQTITVPLTGLAQTREHPTGGTPNPGAILGFAWEASFGTSWFPSVFGTEEARNGAMTGYAELGIIARTFYQTSTDTPRIDYGFAPLVHIIPPTDDPDDPNYEAEQDEAEKNGGWLIRPAGSQFGLSQAIIIPPLGVRGF